MTICESCNEHEALTPELLAIIAPTINKNWTSTSTSDRKVVWTNEPLDVSLEQDPSDGNWLVSFFEDGKTSARYKFTDKYVAGNSIEAFVALWNAPGKVGINATQIIPDNWEPVRAGLTPDGGQLALFRDVDDRAAPYKMVKLDSTGKLSNLMGNYDSLSFIEEDDAVKSYSYISNNHSVGLAQLEKALVWDDTKNMLNEQVI